jgi:hypothetical protein
VAGVILAIAIAYVGPVRGYLDQRAQLRSSQTALRQAQAERNRIARQLANLDQPAVLAAHARELDLVRPGERAYVLQGLPSETPRPAPKRDERSLWDKILDLL